MFKSIKLLSVASLLIFLMAACEKEDEATDPNAPRACFTPAANEAFAGVGIGFDSGCSNNAIAYLWSFGDGGTSLEENPVHTFSDEGRYTVSLTIEDELGTTHTTSTEIEVKPSPFIEHSGYIDVAEVWEEGYHLVKSNVYIRHGSLTIKPGAKIYVNKQRSIFVGHRETTTAGGALLTANGTAEKPIIFQPSSGLQQPGEWGHIFFTGTASTASSLQYCDLQFGGKARSDWDYEPFTYYNSYGVVDIMNSAVHIENTRISGAANYAVSLSRDAYFTTFANNTLTNNTSYPISIYVNNVHTIGTGNHIQGDKGIYVTGTGGYRQPDVTWKRQEVPYVINSKVVSIGDLTAPILRIEAGTTLAFLPDASLSGKIIAEGTASNPIVFTSAQANKAKGDWVYVALGEGSIVKYCHFEYGGGRDSYGYQHQLTSASNTSITYCTITESAGDGLVYKLNSEPEILENNTISNCTKFGLEVPVTTYHLLSSTNTLTNTKGLQISTGMPLNQDATWPKRPYDVYVSGRVHIGTETHSPTLTLAPGTKFYILTGFSVGYYSNTKGSLIADGTSERIVLTMPEEYIAAGTHWSSIEFGPGTMASSKLINCEISYGGGGVDGIGMIHCKETINSPEIRNNLISHSKRYGISTSGATPIVSGNTYSNNAGDDVYKFY